jgi:hypothetical protein
VTTESTQEAPNRIADSPPFPQVSTRPGAAKLAVACAWAGLLGVVGVAVATRGWFALMISKPPAWYEPGLILTGLAGIALTVPTFITIRRRYLPWCFLTLATIALAGAITITIQVS